MGKATTEAEWPEHPLFPADDDEPPKRVEFIQVIRHENGRSQQIPRMFRATELQSLEDIYNLWGGGIYELWGRRASIHNPESHGKMTANRRYEIAGLSKPLMVDGSNTLPQASLAAPSSSTAAQSGAAPDTSVMGMFMQMQMQMFQAAQENARQQAEAQRRADDRARSDSQQMMQMVATLQAQSTQSMMGVLTALVSKGGGGGNVEELQKMGELLKTFGALPGGKNDDSGDDGESVGGIIANLADIVQGAVELKGGLPGVSAPANGSAAAALGIQVPIKKPEVGIG